MQSSRQPIGDANRMIHDLLPLQSVCMLPVKRHEKEEPCNGHIRVFYPFADFFSDLDEELRNEIKKEFGAGKKLKVYKCRLCGAIYRPRPDSILSPI